jgi:alpha-D-ribose 1-methylphosphonate 5-triphosphate synthase subunit PhnG
MLTVRERSEILARADREKVLELAERVRGVCDVVLEKAPAKTLVMLPMIEPVHQTRFFIGELLACEAMASIDGCKGIGVLMGDDFEKVVAVATLDSAFRGDIPLCGQLEETLRGWKDDQDKELRREAALYNRTRVDFNIMEGE